ncbi:MAG: hypothetical protein COT90_03945 [Candidatus Diapherotrites archaeon CG10_big_fil_rev_8_21_14_0_10_31_34]|nr:MAG: hypothetical protein COT90_03945 [Candidatus Diapherotrites archaeon CG10_big_fil_rev_8_21_14_0_10_31_34]PJA17840.1 MAG: hypothetical protein COX63_02605 [Candidatus Diapherotrites archaeon CG_4_10_14_0_2_um_filter_31_5]
MALIKKTKQEKTKKEKKNKPMLTRKEITVKVIKEMKQNKPWAKEYSETGMQDNYGKEITAEVNRKLIKQKK